MKVVLLIPERSDIAVELEEGAIVKPWSPSSSPLTGTPLRILYSYPKVKE